MKHQEGAKPLAPRLDGVAHGFLDPGLAAFRTGQDGVQAGVYQLGAGGYGRSQLGNCRPGGLDDAV